MKTFTYKKGFILTGILSAILMILSLPAVTGAVPPSNPPTGNTDANFYSVTITDGTTDFLKLENDGDIIMYGDNAGNSASISNPNSWFDGVRTIDYPVNVDDNLDVSGGVTGGIIAGASGVFGIIDNSNYLSTNSIYPRGFSTSTSFFGDINSRDSIINTVGDVSVDDNLRVAGHLRAAGGLGSYTRVSDYVYVNNNSYGYAAATCPNGYKVSACGHRYTKVNSAVYYNIPYENYCSTSFHNMTGQNSRIFYSYALCFNPNG